MAASDIMPFYWQNETSGVLRPAVEAYLRGDDMEQSQIVALRAYLRQWINAPVWVGDGAHALRIAIDRLSSRESIADWLDAAQAEGIDPL